MLLNPETNTNKINPSRGRIIYQNQIGKVVEVT